MLNNVCYSTKDYAIFYKFFNKEEYDTFAKVASMWVNVKILLNTTTNQVTFAFGDKKNYDYKKYNKIGKSDRNAYLQSKYDCSFDSAYKYTCKIPKLKNDSPGWRLYCNMYYPGMFPNRNCIQNAEVISACADVRFLDFVVLMFLYCYC